ncbi:hypothetical protein G7046_g6928 [Stylonectria norvegica]|nr:hypothetical protein G7046_g6928 [Stylonectria norvegica]
MSFRTLAARAGAAAKTVSSRSFRNSFGMVQQAKVLSSSLGARPLTTDATKVQEMPGDKVDDVVFESRYGLRTIMLNRPKKLNSLNGSMIRKIIPRLAEWEKSDMANVIVMKGAGEKALCAGGDVAALAHFNQQEDGWKKSTEYFQLEYQLDHFIATYKKPYIAFMDGITMGGGVGLSIHAPFRIATEKTVFAMPETTIGFFPDVGASFFLPRMNGSVGTYLALTSDRLSGPNVLYSGVATHYIHSSSLPDLEARLAELRFHDGDDLPTRLGLINETLEEFCTGLPYDQPIRLGGDVRRAIDRCFNKNNINDIFTALQAERGPTEEWAQKQLKTLLKRSPTAVHVTLKQMRVGGEWDIAETFQRELQIAENFMKHHDFTEGVTALLVEKREPAWTPKSLTVIGDRNVAGPFFEYDGGRAMTLFNDRTFSEYPYETLGVPSEREIRKVVENDTYTQDQLIDTMIASRKGRQGVSEVVREIVERKTEVDKKGKARWVKEESSTTSKLAEMEGLLDGQTSNAIARSEGHETGTVNTKDRHHQPSEPFTVHEQAQQQQQGAESRKQKQQQASRKALETSASFDAPIPSHPSPSRNKPLLGCRKVHGLKSETETGPCCVANTTELIISLSLRLSQQKKAREGQSPPPPVQNQQQQQQQRQRHGEHVRQEIAWYTPQTSFLHPAISGNKIRRRRRRTLHTKRPETTTSKSSIIGRA